MIYQLECTYCGYSWEKLVYNKAGLESACCSKCRDTSLIIREKAKTVDFYQGAPPFQSNEDPFWSE